MQHIDAQVREQVVAAIEQGAADAQLGTDFVAAAREALWAHRLFTHDRDGKALGDVVEAIKQVVFEGRTAYVAWVKTRGRHGRPW
jgi:hypothetical protein